MLTVWGRRTSSNVQAVMWCIAELGQPCERIDIGHRFGGNDTPAFRAMNPNGLVPVLRDGDGEPLWESAAILRYLAGRYGKAPFWPADGLARAAIDIWAEWAKVHVTQAFTVPIFWPMVRMAPADRDPAAVVRAVAALGRLLDIAERQIERTGFLAHEAFTLADIAFGHVLYRYFDIPIDREERPVLRRYYEALVERPAFRAHVMVPYDELRVT